MTKRMLSMIPHCSLWLWWTLHRKMVIVLVLWAVRNGCMVVESKAILGVDLGSLYMKVALVQRGAPLEIVTNLHSKRKTENMILFDSGTRFYGADASSLLARKPLKTPVSMSVMLGRDEQHPVVQVLSERHCPLTPQYNASRSGTSLTVDGDHFTPEELVAMVLGHAKEITQAYAGEQGAPVGSTAASIGARDCVLTVPAFATVHERRALLDAATLADLNVLGLLEENTAAAVHFGMDKVYEGDGQILIFYNLGASACQVSIVKFHSYRMKGGGTSLSKTKEQLVGSVEVLSKAWDATLGGLEFDHRIVEHLADQFNTVWNQQKKYDPPKDIRSIPRAMTKFKIQANKVKHVLSANTEFPLYMESVYDDVSFSTHVTRVQVEEWWHDLFPRAIQPIYTALEAANLTLKDIHGIELLGGGMRIPKIQSELKKALNDTMDLGMHINADESMALGAAFHGANISTAFRVRHVGLTDVNPFPISISLQDLSTQEDEEEKPAVTSFFGKKKQKKDDNDAAQADATSSAQESWNKHATIFKSLSKLGVKKTIAFTHDKDVHCSLDYEQTDMLPEGTETSIQRYNITGVQAFSKEMEEKGLGKPKLSLQFELSLSGTTRLIKAEAAVEEIYTVEEDIEVDENDDEQSDDDDDDSAPAEREANNKEEEHKEQEEKDKETSSKGDDQKELSDEESSKQKEEEKKDDKKKKKKKTVKVEKEKKKVHRKTLNVQDYYVTKVQPHSELILEESVGKLSHLAKKDAERVQLEEARNKVESYIYRIRNKLLDDEENIAKVSTAEQREAVMKLAEDAEEWMYDEGATADLSTMEDKYEELSEPAEKIFFRVKEMSARPESILALQEKLIKVQELLKKWEKDKPHVTEEERSDVLAKVQKVKDWIVEKEAEQEQKQPHEDPAFVSAEVPTQTKSLEQLLSRLSRKPKPKAEKKNETERNTTSTDNSTDTTSFEEDDEDVDSDNDKKSEESSPNADGDADADADADADSDADANSDADADADANADTDADSVVDDNADEDTGADTNVDKDTDLKDDEL